MNSVVRLFVGGRVCAFSDKELLLCNNVRVDAFVFNLFPTLFTFLSFNALHSSSFMLRGRRTRGNTDTQLLMGNNSKDKLRKSLKDRECHRNNLFLNIYI